MDDFVKPIGYLESSDFTDSGSLVGKLENIPVFIMIQGSYCGGCKTAKPDFQRLANEGIVTCMTIQLDGERESERNLQSSGKLDKIYPGLETVPSFVLIKGNKRIPYTNSSRSYVALKQFVKQYV